MTWSPTSSPCARSHRDGAGGAAGIEALPCPPVCCGRHGDRVVRLPVAGAVDCDIHPALPGTHVLVPYFDEYWREMITMRGLDRDDLSLGAYPPGAALTCRPDWRPAKGNPGT